MGYELYIVRQNEYEDSEEESSISLDEWLNYVSTDKELELTNGYKTNIPNIGSNWQDRPGFCNWLGHPKTDIDYTPWFDYGNGCISSKNPDNDTIKKMIQISSKLNAKVRGDDFEYYDETFYTTGRHKDFEEQAESMNSNQILKVDKKPWWKLW